MSSWKFCKKGSGWQLGGCPRCPPLPPVAPALRSPDREPSPFRYGNQRLCICNAQSHSFVVTRHAHVTACHPVPLTAVLPPKLGGRRPWSPPGAASACRRLVTSRWSAGGKTTNHRPSLSPLMPPAPPSFFPPRGELYAPAFWQAGVIVTYEKIMLWNQQLFSKT